MIDNYDLGILRALSEDAGRCTGEVANDAPVLRNQSKHTNSAWVRNRLLCLQKDGLVGPLDDKKPIAWVRTKAGTIALNAGAP